MPQILTNLRTAASGNDLLILDQANMSPSRVLLLYTETQVLNIALRRNFFVIEEEPTSAERDYQEQEEAFRQIPPLLLEAHRGQFVASRNGQIVDSDVDLDSLVDRFFATHGDVPVYITKVGENLREVIDTPFFAG